MVSRDDGTPSLAILSVDRPFLQTIIWAGLTWSWVGGRRTAIGNGPEGSWWSRLVWAMREPIVLPSQTLYVRFRCFSV